MVIAIGTTYDAQELWYHYSYIAQVKHVRFEGVDNNFVVKVLYKQLSLSRVGESHTIRMMISSISNVRIPMYESEPRDSNVI